MEKFRMKIKKQMSVLLAILMIGTAVPMSIFATDIASQFLTGTDAIKTDTDAVLVKEGQCGKNVLWSLHSCGTLVISGEGDMYDFESGGSPWYGENNLVKKIIIETGVTSVGDYSFEDCTYLTKVDMSGSVKVIGACAFSYCESIRSLVLPFGVNEIKDFAFMCCDKLEEIVFPESLKIIGECAFDVCRSLKSVYIPASVSCMVAPFSACYSLSSIVVDKDNEYYSSDSFGVLFNKNKTTLIEYPIGNKRNSYIIPESVTDIDDGSILTSAFDCCDNLKSIAISERITYIEPNLFYYCDNIEFVHYFGFSSTWFLLTHNRNDKLKNIDVHFCTKTSEVLSGCTTDGCLEGWYCSTCEKNIVGGEIIDATGHTTVTHAAKAPTCTEIGWYAYETCENCDYTTYEEIPANGHSYNSIVTKPTCTKEGYTTYKCTCGDNYIADKIPALGHSFTAYVPDNNATCIENGTVSAYCENNCGAKDTHTIENSKIGHKDLNNDGVCDMCSEKLTEEPADNSFFGKIKAFFQRIIDWFRNLFR